MTVPAALCSNIVVNERDEQVPEACPSRSYRQEIGPVPSRDRGTIVVQGTIVFLRDGAVTLTARWARFVI